MRSYTKILLLFFVFYLPVTAVIGLLLGSFQAPGLGRSLAYEFFLWFVVGVQLLLPTLIMLLLVVGLLKLSQRRTGMQMSTRRLKLTSTVAIGVFIPTFQAFFWQGNQLSMDWFAVCVVPAMMLGFLSITSKAAVSSVVKPD